MLFSSFIIDFIKPYCTHGLLATSACWPSECPPGANKLFVFAQSARGKQDIRNQEAGFASVHPFLGRTTGIDIINNTEPINSFGTDLYFRIIVKMTIFEGEKIAVTLQEDTEIEFEIE